MKSASVVSQSITLRVLLGVLVIATLNFAALSALPSKTATNDGDSLDLSTVLSRLDLKLSWNPLLDQAIFSRGNDFLVMQSGVPGALFNASQRLSMPAEAFNPATGQVSLAGYETLSLAFPPQIATDGARIINTIFIDPGHGGKDPGTIGRFSVGGKATQVFEKDIALTVGLDLRDQLRARFPRKKIVMSREKDIYLPLDERTRLANKYSQTRDQNTLYLSLHVNASPNSKGKGFEVWYLPPEYRRQLIAEDDAQIKDKSVRKIVNSIIEEEYTVESILLARSVLQGMENATGGQTINRGMKAEEWYVVRSARMPSILVELGFVSNPDEFLLLRTPTYLHKLGEGIYNGLTSFITDYEKVSSQ